MDTSDQRGFFDLTHRYDALTAKGDPPNTSPNRSLGWLWQDAGKVFVGQSGPGRPTTV